MFYLATQDLGGKGSSPGAPATLPYGGRIVTLNEENPERQLEESGRGWETWKEGERRKLPNPAPRPPPLKAALGLT